MGSGILSKKAQANLNGSLLQTIPESTGERRGPCFRKDFAGHGTSLFNNNFFAHLPVLSNHTCKGSRKDAPWLPAFRADQLFCILFLDPENRSYPVRFVYFQNPPDFQGIHIKYPDLQHTDGYHFIAFFDFYGIP
jgi:hypothetical protein